jgi:hypothetical protein
VTTVLTRLVVWLNTLANSLASVLLAPLAALPGWLSATLIAVTTGVLMLLAFKYTSHQTAIKRVRNEIKANLLALSLFKDSVAVSLSAQGRILWGALRLLGLAVVPMLVMLLPMCLLLGQLAAWYQARPLQIGEETVVTVHLADDSPQALRQVQLIPSDAVTTTVGPVRVPARQMVCWNVQARQAGYHQLTFSTGDKSFEKEMAIGDGLMRVSPQRPAWHWTDALLYPRETPFATDSPVQSIELVYPPRQSWTAGTRSWLIYWFTASMVAAFVARPLLNVNI